MMGQSEGQDAERSILGILNSNANYPDAMNWLLLSRDMDSLELLQPEGVPVQPDLWVENF